MRKILHIYIVAFCLWSCSESHADREALIEEALQELEEQEETDEEEEEETSLMYYSSEISSLLDLHCVSCHSNANATSSLSLEGYQNAKTSFDTGTSLERIQSTTNPMPPAYKTPLSVDEIAKLIKWQNDGFLETDPNL